MLHIYKASAGSGKTYTLTRQYLLLMLGNFNRDTGRWSLKAAPDCANRHILAITFTNKATEEMIKRIISQLAILGGREEGESPYIDDLVKTLDTDPDSLRALASAVLDELLADFVYFNVSTIDSFFQNVLRIFAREIEMPDNFEIEIENKYAMAVGVSEMFRVINLRGDSDPVLARERQWMMDWLNQYMNSRIDSGESVNLLSKSSSLYGDLISTFSRLFSETFKLNKKKISKYLEKLEKLVAFEKGIKAQRTTLENHLTELAKIIKGYEVMKFVKPAIVSRIDSWLSDRDLQASKDMPKAISEGRTVYKARYNVSKVPKSVSLKDIDPFVEDFCNTYYDLVELTGRNKIILDSISPLGLLGLLLKNLDRYCKDNNLILLSETNTLLREIINCDDTPFVYERLGYYLNNFLIDEFQDTSKMQWLNIRPLILESLSNKHEDLIIGDEKQCIYRFRNSDPTLLGTQVGNDVNSVYDTENLVSVEGAKISENNNWRSAHEVVKFNNSLFYSLGKLLDTTGTYANVIQQINPKRKTIPGHTRLIFLPEKEKKSSKKDTDTAAPQAAPSEASSNAQAAPAPEEEDATRALNLSLETMVAEIHRLLRSGYAPGDICVLVRTHSEGSKAIARILDFAATPEAAPFNIEVTSSDALYLSDSPAVRMVIEILRLTQIPHMVKTEKQRPDGSTYVVEKESEVYRRTRLRYLFEYCRNTIVDFPDGPRKPTHSEALVIAIDLLKLHTDIDPQGNIHIVENPSAKTLVTLTDAMREVLEFKVENLLRGQSQVVNNEAPSTTLSSIVDTVIGKYLLPDTIKTETIFLTALQDLVYDFCNRGNSDIRAFLDYWDRGARNTKVTANDTTSAINVMTIHASKGLEFPCVIIPFADWDFVEYSTQYKPRTDWFAFTEKDFPDIHPDVIPPMIPVEFTSKIPTYPLFKEQADKIIAEQRIDNLNVAYVALTRAVNELSVITSEYKKESFGTYLRLALADLTADNLADADYVDPASAPWLLPLSEMTHTEPSDITVVEVGTPTLNIPKETPKETPNAADTTPQPAATEYILPPYNPHVNTRLSALTRLDAKFFDFSKPRHRGDLLHYIMRRVIHLADLPRALRRIAYRANLTPSQTRYCADILRNVTDDPRVTPWFEGYQQVIIERPLLGGKNADGTNTIRRPDRVVITADGHIDIIDYKFSDTFPTLARLAHHIPNLSHHIQELPPASTDASEAPIHAALDALAPSEAPVHAALDDLAPSEAPDLLAAAAQLRDYIKQLRRYAKMLSDSTPAPRLPIRAYLWFVATRRILRVTL